MMAMAMTPSANVSNRAVSETPDRVFPLLHAEQPTSTNLNHGVTKVRGYSVGSLVASPGRDRVVTGVP